MPGFTVQRSGFTRVPELMFSVVTDMLANGFTQTFPTTPLLGPIEGTPYGLFKVVLSPSATVDSLAVAQPWRILFDIDNAQEVDVNIATPLQISNDGKVSFLDKVDNTSTANPLGAGALNTLGTPVANTGSTDPVDQKFIARTNRVFSGTEGSYPMTYRLTITPHGIVLFIWEDASDAYGNHFSWLSVQRPVDHVTGIVTTTGHTPLFCVYGLNGKVGKIIVRENDVSKPTKSVSASVNSIDNASIINETQQVAITENNRYVVTFPNGLNTQRYVYTEELDLIAYTSADVVSQYSDVPVTVYGESTPRTYKAMNANGVNNTGMRLLMLTAGGPMA